MSGTKYAFYNNLDVQNTISQAHAFIYVQPEHINYHCTISQASEARIWETGSLASWCSRPTRYSTSAAIQSEKLWEVQNILWPKIIRIDEIAEFWNGVVPEMEVYDTV